MGSTAIHLAGILLSPFRKDSIKASRQFLELSIGQIDRAAPSQQRSNSPSTSRPRLKNYSSLIQAHPQKQSLALTADFFKLSHSPILRGNERSSVFGDYPDNIQIRAHNWGQNLSLEQSLKLEPFIREIGRRLESGLHYLPELLDREVVGSVELQIATDSKGIIQHMTVNPDQGPYELQGLALSQIKTSLSTSQVVEAPTPFVKMAVKVHFQIVHTRNEQQGRDLEINRNELAINVFARKSAKYDITEWSLEDNIFLKLFGRKKLNQRETYDFKLKTQNLALACEIEMVDEVCLATAKNYLMLGQLKDARKFLKLACQKAENPDCQKLRNLVETTNEEN